MTINRRSFIKMASAAMASLAYTPDIFASGDETQIITHATHMGPLKGYVKNGKLEKILASEHDFDPVDLMFSLKEATYSPTRIKQPCVRKSYLDGSDKRNLRGAEEFIQVSWEKALDLTAKALQDVKRIYGNESIFRTSYARWSHPGHIQQPANLLGRTLGLFGGFTDVVGDYSAGASVQVLPYIVGDSEVYSMQTSREVVLENVELIMMWGLDPFKTSKIDYNVPDHSTKDWFLQMKQKGVQFITIDPTKNLTTRKLDSEWVPIKAATDVAMIIGMCHTLYTENLYDKEFIAKYTVGFTAFSKYLTGEHDGIEKTAEWAESICGVPAEKIKQLARLAMTKRTTITGSWAPQRIHHGEQFHWSLVALASMIGQIGLPGGGFSFNMHFCGAGTSYSGAKRPLLIPQGRNPVNTLIPASRMGDTFLNPGKTIDYNGSKLTYPNIKLLYSAGLNPIGLQPDLNKLIEGCKRIEHIITNEPWWTPTAKFSDIVLPVTTSFERDDIAFGSSYGVEHLWAMKQLISPLFEAKDDFWVFREISKRLGFENEFTDGKTIEEWIRWSFEMSQPSVDFETFWEKGFVYNMTPEENKKYIRHSEFRANPQKNRLSTPSGRIELFSEKIASFGYEDCPGFPKWITPAEGINSYASRRFPYHLITPHPMYRLHSQLDNTRVSRDHKFDDREPMYINPENAKQLGISHGEIVEVYNNRGHMLAGAFLTENIVKDSIAIDEGAWYAPENPREKNSRCLSGQANILTSDRPSSKLAQATTSNSCMVGIRKVKGRIKRNTAYDEPDIRKGDL
ncbi:molybdopterin oxidoreductase [Denitrovibrio acetiphilus DSM 12809]|uniref:trimethylamine-N-oxide reductase n=1 Tax=Denitrovibrio acetiphilus (strain DSM 12809 / NBRC 114555 / N2460) TaxID=522772 RepID=D4H8R5_DENA2|nr:molybdopterin-dependent oxidoreductase [Denitrovibrio acetiphilus]ADD68414.1 molybdopterin oxidoreductase [Denitrovibrio acetiphilus DSM 12809]